MGSKLKELQKLYKGDENNLLYYYSSPGFTYDLFGCKLAIDHDLNYRMVFRYFDPKIKILGKPDFYCEGMIPESIKQKLTELIAVGFSDLKPIYSPYSNHYVPDDTGSHEYLINTKDGFLRSSLYSISFSDHIQFKTKNEILYYELHCKLLKWIQGLYDFVKQIHYSDLK
ncbi:hypothetical protein FMM05_01530 [Flavobacterium zepuense]|uniref:Uncharacterized protein n=1 Tax=Flavobacterium zepuense TaxID=2593302 RepID=A0A552VA39_9FLAO|nr:hypothetical protein [Flavobacterium zepuense]TRW27347.1 hypothetical protein FMM05_01530 [Flavobacterium zepuense]